MGTLKTLTRRTFLVSSAAIAGGVAFGTYYVAKDPANPLKALVQNNGAAFNPWVMIDGQTITLVVPHADKGQGVQSVQAMLLAEELDVDLDQVSLTFGVPSAAYFNTAMSEAAPFRSDDRSMPAEMARSVVGTVMKVLGVQVTGGSTTVADSFEKLRAAGAAARETLKAAAAARTGHDTAALKTERGQVILPDGQSISYQDLAQEAATMTAPSGIELRPASAWRMLGKDVQRTDIVAKSTGQIEYGIDLRMEGMLHATVKTNPYRGGTLNWFDDSVAKEMRGVKDIFEIENGVAVVATNTWYAFQAADAVVYDWGQTTMAPDQQTHWAEVEGSFTPERLNKEWINIGDIEAHTGQSDAITAQYRAPYVAHQPLEPLNATVRVTDDRIDIWAGHQVPLLLVQRVASRTGYDVENVHFHNMFMGGSFGHRLEFDFIDQAVQVAQRVKGTPVKMTLTREEDFLHDYPRHISAAIGIGRSGPEGIEALDISVASTSASQSQMGRIGLAAGGPDAQVVMGAWNAPYDLEHFRSRGYVVPGLAPTSSWRSVGASSAGFFMESFVDELCHHAGKDPLEERLRLANTPSARAVLEAVGEMSGWGSEMAQGSGRGIAMVQSFAVNCAQVIDVTMTEAGLRIDKVYVAADVGTVLDPINFDNLVKGGVVWALGHAMNCEVTYQDGRAEQENFYAHEGMRLYQCPQIDVRGLEVSDTIAGIGEPPVPPAAPALANAIFAATGQRLREMPFNKFIDFI